MIQRTAPTALAALLLLLLASPAKAQGISLGIGFAVPVVGQDIVTAAHNDTSGVTHTDMSLDSSPQLIIEFHVPVGVGSSKKVKVGPAFGFLPKLDFGIAGNNETTQGVGAGFGGVVSFPAGGKRHLNMGLMWVIQQPVATMDEAWRDGFQAPRDRFDQPVPPNFTDKSPQRLMLFFSLSGLFG